ncbi:MAG: hypothetical protein EXR49_01375 [Dehalococcoidia bacterium]|nr:hypothetical protein [Dehalococcoidia bacterium]
MEVATVKIGEIVTADSAAFSFQCHALGQPPPLGSLVLTGEADALIYGIVHSASTLPIDRGRQVQALGPEFQDEAALYQQHPELDQLLRTEVQALIAGYGNGSALRYSLPPRPARIHGFVLLASASQVQQFTRDLSFVATLVGADVPHRDHALAACLRLAAAAHDKPRDFLVGAGREAARLLAADAPRLHLLLRQIAP